MVTVLFQCDNKTFIYSLTFITALARAFLDSSCNCCLDSYYYYIEVHVNPLLFAFKTHAVQHLKLLLSNFVYLKFGIVLKKPTFACACIQILMTFTYKSCHYYNDWKFRSPLLLKQNLQTYLYQYSISIWI